MVAGILTGSYNEKLYASLGAVEKVSENVALAQILELCRIIQKYGHAERVCAVIAHRHHDLSPKEAMFETTVGDETIAKAMPISEIKRLGGHPTVIGIDGNGRWFPLGYGKLDEESVGAWEDEAFLFEAASYLVDNQLGNKLLLALRLETQQPEYGMKKAVEFNYSDTRTSIVRWVDAGEYPDLGLIDTAFVLDKKNQLVCEHCCSSHTVSVA